MSNGIEPSGKYSRPRSGATEDNEDVARLLNTRL